VLSQEVIDGGVTKLEADLLRNRDQGHPQPDQAVMSVLLENRLIEPPPVISHDDLGQRSLDDVSLDVSAVAWLGLQISAQLHRWGGAKD
jgi:hypothetical protein